MAVCALVTRQPLAPRRMISLSIAPAVPEITYSPPSAALPLPVLASLHAIPPINWLPCYVVVVVSSSQHRGRAFACVTLLACAPPLPLLPRPLFLPSCGGESNGTEPRIRTARSHSACVAVRTCGRTGRVGTTLIRTTFALARGQPPLPLALLPISTTTIRQTTTLLRVPSWTSSMRPWLAVNLAPSRRLRTLRPRLRLRRPSLALRPLLLLQHRELRRASLQSRRKYHRRGAAAQS